MAAASDQSLERRAWVVARPELERLSRRWYDQVIRIFESTKTVSVTQVYRTGPGVGASMAKDKQAERLACLQFAVSDVVAGFTPEQRHALKEAGVLPADFIERVRREAAVVRTRVKW